MSYNDKQWISSVDRILWTVQTDLLKWIVWTLLIYFFINNFLINITKINCKNKMLFLNTVWTELI